ncbi:MAG: hypothetical protein WCS01_10370, partial [bacterium]
MPPGTPLPTLPGTPASTASPAHRRKQLLTHLDALHSVPHPAACPRCGESRGWTRHDWYWRELLTVSRYLPGVSVKDDGIWV